MNILKILLITISIMACQFKASAQNDTKVLDSLYEEIEFLISESWYLEKTKQGFRVTFCRSCMENYNSYIDSTDFFSRELARSDFFLSPHIDSVSYYPILSLMPIPRAWSKQKRIDYYTDFYKPNDVLQFNITIEKKWKEEKYDAVLKKNNVLKDAILKEPLYKSNEDIFSDYRFWLPRTYWKKRTHQFNYFFERLPYTSLTINKSILIEHNKPSFFCEPMLINRNDPEFFYKKENHVETERRRTLKVIALTLGIHDYQIVN
ncbi:MAG: hypothetical protein HRT58_05915 [Crocinitomicaceae bacterium]|nr:hypothetical protein [Flavobacteriales bacterium]NQZ35178.1 hypothetical protein [Crocinitomicaceae bacterium]